MNREVPMGGFVVTEEGGNLTCQAVGSCIVIALYDGNLKIAGMIHAMLPYAHNGSSDIKCVDTAIDVAVEKMCSLGADKRDMTAKLVGGANMFGFTTPDIGRENVKSAKKKLKEVGIKLVGESTGGSIGRSVEFSTETGIVVMRISF